MSILELIVVLIGGSVIAFMLYGAFRFWRRKSRKRRRRLRLPKKAKTDQADPVPGKSLTGAL